MFFEFFNDWSPEAVVISTLLFLMITVLVVVGALCIQAGIFHSIQIRTKEPEFGELIIMYKCGHGAYSESSALFTESHSIFPEYDCIGVYYDDPQKKTSDNLRYIVGLVLAEGGAEPNPEHVAIMEEKGYKKVTFPKVKYAVTTDFPMRNTLSCVFAVFRVYPALREYVERKELCAHPFIELYHNSSKRILFTGPLEQQDSFYVSDLVEDACLSSPNEESCDDEDDSVREDSDEEVASVKADSVVSNEANNWDKSASIIDEAGSAMPQEAIGTQQGSEESDTNTASSFEEIDPSETATIPVDTSVPQPTSTDESIPPPPPPASSTEPDTTSSTPDPTTNTTAPDSCDTTTDATTASPEDCQQSTE